MTDVYTHTLDQTLEQEWLATKERINAAGARVALTNTADRHGRVR